MILIKRPENPVFFPGAGHALPGGWSHRNGVQPLGRLRRGQNGSGRRAGIRGAGFGGRGGSKRIPCRTPRRPKAHHCRHPVRQGRLPVDGHCACGGQRRSRGHHCAEGFGIPIMPPPQEAQCVALPVQGGFGKGGQQSAPGSSAADSACMVNCGRGRGEQFGHDGFRLRLRSHPANGFARPKVPSMQQRGITCRAKGCRSGP